MPANPKDVKDYLEACGWIYEKEAKRYYNEKRDQHLNLNAVENVIQSSETTLDAVHWLDMAIDRSEPVKPRS